MPIVNYVREHIRFMEYATDEHITASERLLWYALMHIMNQRAQGNVWPDEFIRISNDRLLSYCPMKFDTMASARNGLKQRGLIEFTKGEKNKLSPAYRMIYFYPQYMAPETEKDGESYPKNSDYMGDNTGGNIGDNTGNNPGSNKGDFNINYTNGGTYTQGKPLGIHTQERNCQDYPAPREPVRLYRAMNDQFKPCRYDSAWRTSKRARGAVAQRIIEKLRFSLDDCSTLHGRLMEYMDLGMIPELIEDVAETASTAEGFLYALDRLAEDRGLSEDEKEWERCLKIARGNEEFAKQLYSMRRRNKDETA